MHHELLILLVLWFGNLWPDGDSKTWRESVRIKSAFLKILASARWRHGQHSHLTARRSWVGRDILCQCPRPNALMTIWVSSPKEDGSKAENKFHCTPLYISDKLSIWQGYSKFDPPCYCIVGLYHLSSSCTEVWSTFQDGGKLYHVVERETSEMNFSFES